MAKSTKQRASIENKIASVIEGKMKSKMFIPSDELLNELGLRNRTRWDNLLSNKVNINILEVRAFAKWLEVDEDEIIVKKKVTLFENRYPSPLG